jgi:predicted transcriptional regulator of viral defense system
MYNLVKPLTTREELLKRKIRIFSNLEFTQIFGLSPYQAEYELRQLTDEGLLSRLKRGLYVLKTDPPSEEEVANALYKPSYISFEYALAYYNIIPEMTYQITSATTKPTRLFTTNHSVFSYYTIKQEAYTGYVLAQRGEKWFYIADREKALVDYLYIISLGQRVISGGRFLNDRLNLQNLNRDKILIYAQLYHWSKLDKLVEEVLTS